MALSKRLTAIAQMVPNEYDEIWDCCCDHGFLGMQLLKDNRADQIHFVDIVPELMQSLQQTLARFSTEEQRGHWQVHCQDVATISLTPQKRHLVIIAGVGGDLMCQFISQIQAHNHLAHIDFIVCPVHHSYKVRSHLQSLDFGLVAEHLISENRRFYELMFVSASAKTPITRVGQGMWQLTNKEHQAYLGQLCAHYQRMLNQDADYYQQVLDEYTRLMRT